MEGYVYILTNDAMPGLIKIGCTTRSTEERKRELSKPTGIPLEFNIEYEIFSSEMKILEAYIHQALDSYRVNKAKEFFKVDIFKAIELLHKKAEEIRLNIELKVTGTNEVFEPYEAIEILGKLQSMHPKMIRKEIKSVRVYQTRLRCYLEITEEKKYERDGEISLKNQKIYRQDLGFISNDIYPETLDLFLNQNFQYRKMLECSYSNLMPIQYLCVLMVYLILMGKNGFWINIKLVIKISL